MSWLEEKQGLSSIGFDGLMKPFFLSFIHSLAYLYLFKATSFLSVSTLFERRRRKCMSIETNRNSEIPFMLLLFTFRIDGNASKSLGIIFFRLDLRKRREEDSPPRQAEIRHSPRYSSRLRSSSRVSFKNLFLKILHANYSKSIKDGDGGSYGGEDDQRY